MGIGEVVPRPGRRKRINRLFVVLVVLVVLVGFFFFSVCRLVSTVWTAMLHPHR
jgi:hypothetical protein